MKLLLTVAGLAVGAAMVMPTAKADTSDDLFYDRLLDGGLFANSKSIPLAHQLCKLMDNGEEPKLLAGDIGTANPDFTFIQSVVFVAAAIEAYCPWQSRATRGA
jgi:hypothetical protein